MKNIIQNKIEPKLLNLFHKKPSADLIIEGIKGNYKYYVEILSKVTILKGFDGDLQATTSQVLWMEADQELCIPMLQTIRPLLDMKL